MDPLKMYFLLKMVIFHCYVSLPEGMSVVKVEQIPSSKPTKGHDTNWQHLDHSQVLWSKKNARLSWAASFFPKNCHCRYSFKTWCSKIHEVIYNMFWRYVGCSPGMLNSCFCFGTPPQAAASHLIQKIPTILSLMNQFKILFRVWQKWNRG